MIRVAREGDWAAIPELQRLAFTGEHGANVARFVQELHDSEWEVPELSFVAEEDGVVVGNVMNTWSTLAETGRRVLTLSPLGVLPEHQRRGHGSALVQASLAGVRALGEPVLTLEGDPRYYARFGFVRADELGLLPPPGMTHPWAFQVAIVDSEAELPRGTVVYSPPFEKL